MSSLSTSNLTASKRNRAVALRNYFSPFGNKLIEAGYVGPDQMKQALVETRKTGRPLTDVLQVMTGEPLSPDLIRQYKKHHLFELKILEANPYLLPHQ